VGEQHRHHFIVSFGPIALVILSQHNNCSIIRAILVLNIQWVPLRIPTRGGKKRKVGQSIIEGDHSGVELNGEERDKSKAQFASRTQIIEKLNPLDMIIPNSSHLSSFSRRVALARLKVNIHSPICPPCGL
jgi:hypothetical protein